MPDRSAMPLNPQLVHPPCTAASQESQQSRTFDWGYTWSEIAWLGRGHLSGDVSFDRSGVPAASWALLAIGSAKIDARLVARAAETDASFVDGVLQMLGRTAFDRRSDCTLLYAFRCNRRVGLGLPRLAVPPTVLSGKAERNPTNTTLPASMHVHAASADHSPWLAASLIKRHRGACHMDARSVWFLIT